MVNSAKGLYYTYQSYIRLNADIVSIEKLKKDGEEVFNKFLKPKRNFYEYLICLDEIFCNSIIHGYLGQGGPVDIIFTVYNGYLVTDIIDYGTGIPDIYIQQLQDTNDYTIKDGCGLLIVKNIADHMIIRNEMHFGSMVSFCFEI